MQSIYYQHFEVIYIGLKVEFQSSFLTLKTAVDKILLKKWNTTCWVIQWHLHLLPYRHKSSLHETDFLLSSSHCMSVCVHVFFCLHGGWYSRFGPVISTPQFLLSIHCVLTSVSISLSLLSGLTHTSPPCSRLEQAPAPFSSVCHYLICLFEALLFQLSCACFPVGIAVLQSASF